VKRRKIIRIAEMAEGAVSFGIRDVIVNVIVFGMFFWTPTMSNYLLRKYKVKVLGEELVPIVLPIIAGILLYQREWSMGIFALIASVGYFMGLWYVHTKSEGKVILVLRTHS